jgi:dolichol-phosphate mannosyltransferase
MVSIILKIKRSIITGKATKVDTKLDITYLLKMLNLGIVIPTYNEIDNINILLNSLTTELESTELKTRILIMDDSSPDGTGAEITKWIAEHDFKNTIIELHTREGKQGLASAYTQGFSYLIERFGPEFLLSMDADMSHNPEYIEGMMQKIRNENLDLVVGSRYVKGGGVVNWSWFRKLISRGGSIYAKSVLGMSINDLTGGYNLYRKNIFQKLDLDNIKAQGYLFQIEMKYRTAQNKFILGEYPIIFADRINGQSKISKFIIIEALLGTIGLRFSEIAVPNLDMSEVIVKNQNQN